MAIKVTRGKNIDLTSGSTGGTGADGVDGLSAYEIAVNEGFVGTPGEWIESLQGQDARLGFSRMYVNSEGELVMEYLNTGTANSDDFRIDDEGYLHVELNNG